MDMIISLNSRLIASLSSVLRLSHAEMISATGITKSTWYNLMETPDAIALQQLLAIANGLHIPVRRFFYEGKLCMVEQKDDYVVQPYQDCYYDAGALQEYVSNRPDATWRKAAEATGMAPSRLRNSLLAMTRTPVSRFLTVCSVFDIDPFSVLIDPNPEKVRDDHCTKPGASSSSADIDALRRDVSKLSDTVSDLLQKYNDLQQQFNDLLRNSDSHVHIAADPFPDLIPDDD